MTTDGQNKLPKPRSWVQVVWWILTAMLAVWALQATVQGNLKLAAGFIVAALLASPILQKVLRTALPKWAPGTLAIGIALAALVASPPNDIAAPIARPAPTKDHQPTASDTLPGRVTNALQLVEVLIRDDLYSEPAHRGDYETAALSNELQQNDDWGTLAFEAMRAERQGRDIDNLAALLSRASVYQTREFPRYRAGYAKQAHGKVWEDDIAVSVRGGRSDTLRLTGPVFAANRNIADLQRALTEGASRVRFKRVEYQAFQGGPLTFFDLETPGDDEVGVWVGSEFMSASKPSRAEEASMLNPRSVER